MEDLKIKVETILKKALPKETFLIVKERKHFDKKPYLQIAIATSDHKINNVSGQFPDLVSLCLEQDFELRTQVYGGCGGGSILVKPNPNDPREKYLAMARRKVSFRKPKQDEKHVLKAIERFANNWLKTIKENEKDLFYTSIVDYKPFL